MSTRERREVVESGETERQRRFRELCERELRAYYERTAQEEKAS